MAGCEPDSSLRPCEGRLNEIGVIVSTARGFDLFTGLRRVDPLDEAAVTALVG